MRPRTIRAAPIDDHQDALRTASATPRDAARFALISESAAANVILASLPRAVRERVVSHATPLQLRAGDLVERQGGPKRVFFPLSGLLTGVRTREDGTHYAYLHRGREAAVNAIGVVRPEVTSAGCDLVVDVAGVALVLPVARYRAMLDDTPDLMRAILTHASHVIAWRERSADCLGHHPVHARTAYYLLLLLAHQGGDVVTVTHARIADVLGVRRQSISEALGELKDAGVVELDRGHVRIAQPAALRHHACDCRANVDAVRQLHLAGRLSYTG